MNVGAASAGLDFTPLAPLAQRLRRLRVGIVYWWRHHRWPDLDTPRRFTEWVQWRKLNDRNPTLSALTDKLWSKEHAVRRCGADLPVPTLWSGRVLPGYPPAPLPLVVKANHGCGQFAIVRTMADWRRAQRRSARWLRRHYGEWLDEVHYRSARRTLLVEPFLGGKGADLPEDYKVYVFGGRAAVVQHHQGRGSAHRWTQYDRGWARVGGSSDTAPCPDNLARMIEVAERLAAGHDFLRVDFYDVDGRLWFGEYCLFPGSGLDPFSTAALDQDLGALWSAARH